MRAFVIGALLALSPSAVHAQLEEFDESSAVVHPAIGPTSIVRAACVRAKVLEANRSALEKCRPSARERMRAILEAAAVLQRSFCAAGDAPIGEPWLSERVRAAEKAFEAALAARSAADAESVDAATEILKQAEADRDRAYAMRARSLEADKASIALDEAYAALIAAGSPEDFEAFLQDPSRHEACREVRNAMLEGYAAAVSSTRLDEELKARTDESRVDARASDLMRKSSSTSTAMTTALGKLESPGAPDAVAFSVLTALGAERETTGTQVLLTLNVARLFEPSEAKLLSREAAFRNLFVRAMLPLETTAGSSITPATEAPDEAAASSSNDVTRFQFVLGTSLFDASDPRLSTHSECYERVRDYLPMSPNEAHELNDVAPVREAFLDMCHRRAANSHRLALRAGVGLATEAEKTRAEVFAAALVWAPVSQLYFNVIYQRMFEPEKAHNFGFGISLADNVGGADSGVDAWARVGLDMLWIVAVPDDADDPMLEARILPKLLFKLGDSVASLGVGPRISRANDNDEREVGVLAVLSLTYDADQLINPLVTPLSTRNP